MRGMGRAIVILIGALVVTLAAAGCAALSRQTGAGAAAGPATADTAALRPLPILTVDPRDQSLLTATAKGVYRTSDNGKTWQRLPVPAALAGAGLNQVVVNPDNPLVVYASGKRAGVIWSDDGGQTWRAVSNGLPNKDVDALAIHTFRRDTLYAWIKDQGIFQTEDGGATWKLMHPGPDDPNVIALAHSTLEGSMNTGWVYAGTPEGAYLSMD